LASSGKSRDCSRPIVPAAFATAATPDSFADEEYYGIDAFVFVNKAGARQAVRYQMLPDRLVHLVASDAARRPPDFLIEELPGQLKRGPVTFHLKVQLAAADDSTVKRAVAKPTPRKRLARAMPSWRRKRSIWRRSLPTFAIRWPSFPSCGLGGLARLMMRCCLSFSYCRSFLSLSHDRRLF
jgi:hypothetical protein